MGAGGHECDLIHTHLQTLGHRRTGVVEEESRASPGVMETTWIGVASGRRTLEDLGRGRVEWSPGRGVEIRLLAHSMNLASFGGALHTGAVQPVVGFAMSVFAEVEEKGLVRESGTPQAPA